MKKNDILEMIKAHVMNNDATFRSIAYDIARDFNSSGDEELADYILSLLSSSQSFVAQGGTIENSDFFVKLYPDKEPLYLPDVIMKDLMGIVNAVNKKVGLNKFLFQGDSGTGKTESVKQLGRILKKDIYSVNFDTIIDSKLGQTAKNITSLFKEINSFSRPQNIIVLFDEIDALALDRINSNDLREMGRATSTLLKQMDSINEELTIIATTNLFEQFDKALIRRFDAVINFNRYTLDDLCEIADNFVKTQSNKFSGVKSDTRLLHKLVGLFEPQITPGNLKNLIKMSVAFSDPSDPSDYLRLIYNNIPKKEEDEIKYLDSKNFTLREIELLTRKPKSSVSRYLGGK